MDYLGLFSLGCFVGTIATLGVKFMKDVATWKQGLATIIAATLAGTATLFVDRFRSSDALGAYCLGLLIALLWTYADVAVERIQSTIGKIQFLGWLHLVGVILASLGGLALVVPPAVLAAWKICQPTP